MSKRLAILLVGIALFGASGWSTWQYVTQFRPQPIPTEVLSLTTVASPSPSTTTVPVVISTAPPTTEPVASTTSTTVPVVYGRPVHLTIEKIGVDDPLVPINLGPQGELEAVPFTIAWYQGSVWPEQPGPMLVAAHVAWAKDGPDRFARLTELRSEDKFQLANELGEIFTYVVTDIYQVDKEDGFNPFIHDVIYANKTEHVLWLNTCGGELRPTGSFADNIFVRATLVPEEG